MADSTYGGPVDINFNSVGTSNITVNLDRSSTFYLVQTSAQGWSFKVWGAEGSVPLKELEITEGALSVTFSDSGNYTVRVGVQSSNNSASFDATLTQGAITVQNPNTGASDKITEGDRQASVNLPTMSK